MASYNGGSLPILEEVGSENIKEFQKRTSKSKNQSKQHMINPIRVITTVTLIAAFVFSGCDSPSNKMDQAETSVIEANRDLEIAMSEVEAELRMYRAEKADQIMEFNRTLSDINRKIENESDMEIKVKLEKESEELKESLRTLKSEMDNYKADGRENWDNFKDNFSSRMNDLGDSLNDFFSPPNTSSSIN